MPYKDNKRQREYLRDHYKNNKGAYIASLFKQKLLKRDWVNALKETTPCTDCGKNWPYYVMDFDHTSKDKTLNVSAMIAQRYSMESIKAEIVKCELVCSNCHRERSHRRRVSAVVVQR